MKELETNPNNVIRTEINVKKQQKAEHTLEGTIKPKKGHKVWEVNEETGVIREADYKVDAVVFNFMAKKEPSKLVINDDCVYIPALNASNAKKKYLENNSQSHYYQKEALMELPKF
jgi:hypothetical protein